MSLKCENDWISKNGTSYEDSCCTSLETAQSWHYRLAQTSHIVFSGLGISIILIYLRKFRRKHILPGNIRILVDLMLLLIVLHSMDMILIHIYHLFQSFGANFEDPCSVRSTVSFCAPFRYTYSFCTVGLAICTYCIYIDRLACAFWRSYGQWRRWILMGQLGQLTVLPFLLIAWVYRNEDPDSYLLSCLNIPTASVPDLTILTIAIFPINFICFFLSIVLFKRFKHIERGSRFDVIRHFSASVDVGSSEFLYRTTGTQAALMAMYSVVSISMRLVYHDLPRPIALTIATLSYIFSIFCFTVPLVIVQYVQQTCRLRKSRISSQVGLKSIGIEGSDNYFEMFRNQWE